MLRLTAWCPQSGRDLSRTSVKGLECLHGVSDTDVVCECVVQLKAMLLTKNGDGRTPMELSTSALVRTAVAQRMEALECLPWAHKPPRVALLQ